MERSFTDRIAADMRRGEFGSTAAEEVAQLERWVVDGAPDPEAPAARFREG